MKRAFQILKPSNPFAISKEFETWRTLLFALRFCIRGCTAEGLILSDWLLAEIERKQVLQDCGIQEKTNVITSLFVLGQKFVANDIESDNCFDEAYICAEYFVYTPGDVKNRELDIICSDWFRIPNWLRIRVAERAWPKSRYALHEYCGFFMREDDHGLETRLASGERDAVPGAEYQKAREMAANVLKDVIFVYKETNTGNKSLLPLTKRLVDFSRALSGHCFASVLGFSLPSAPARMAAINLFIPLGLK